MTGIVRALLETRVNGREVWYHGTSTAFDRFDLEFSGQNFYDDDQGKIFFTNDPGIASNYASAGNMFGLDEPKGNNIHPVYLDENQLLKYGIEGFPISFFDDNSYVYDDAIHQGYKGIIIHDHNSNHKLAVVGDSSVINSIFETADQIRNLKESFFANNADILMPVIRGLMKTAARPLIYKLWKRGSKNAVAALAAIKKLHDQGDPNPIHTLYQQSNLDVPTQFLKRLAWEAGLHDIPGVRPEHKPGLLPSGEGLTENEEITGIDEIPPEALKDDWKPGERAAYEYHCTLEHDSDHAELWYRSHSWVIVLGIIDGGPEGGDTLATRQEVAQPRVYKVRFDDGYTGEAFEDELFVSPEFFTNQFCPPPQEEIDAARRIRSEQE